MIYFIRCTATGLIKIGHAADPWARFSKIQSDTPGKLEMLALEEGGVEREAELHAQFQRSRGEWFFNTVDLAGYIASLGPAARSPRGSKTREFWGSMCDAEVARALGVNKSFIHEIRTGKRRPSPENAIRLQRATGKSAIALIFGDLAGEAA